jgi:hypothetical protein
LKITRLGFGSGIKRKYHQVGRGPWPGYQNRDEFAAPPYEQVIDSGVRVPEEK